jgi:hypothetical protein
MAWQASAIAIEGGGGGRGLKIIRGQKTIISGSTCYGLDVIGQSLLRRIDTPAC